MVARRKQHSSQRPVQQGPAVTASQPNKIGASTPYNFRGKKPTMSMYCVALVHRTFNA